MSEQFLLSKRPTTVRDATGCVLGSFDTILPAMLECVFHVLLKLENNKNAELLMAFRPLWDNLKTREAEYKLFSVRRGKLVFFTRSGQK